MNRICPTEELLSEYLSGTISPEDRKAVESHLASCADCRKLLSEAYDVLITPDLHEIFFNIKRWLRKNIWLIVAVSALASSFFFPKYFIQLITATILSGTKWIIDAKTTKMLITIYETWKKSDKDTTDSIFSDTKKN
jgi:hypothetical protein